MRLLRAHNWRLSERDGVNDCSLLCMSAVIPSELFLWKVPTVGSVTQRSFIGWCAKCHQTRFMSPNHYCWDIFRARRSKTDVLSYRHSTRRSRTFHFRYTCVFACVCINCRAFRSLTMPCWKTDQYKCCDGCAVSNILGIVKQILDLVDSKTQYSSFETRRQVSCAIQILSYYQCNTTNNKKLAFLQYLVLRNP